MALANRFTPSTSAFGAPAPEVLPMSHAIRYDSSWKGALLAVASWRWFRSSMNTLLVEAGRSDVPPTCDDDTEPFHLDDTEITPRLGRERWE